MASAPSSNTPENPQARLARALIEPGMVAFDPASDLTADAAREARAEFESVLQR